MLKKFFRIISFIVLCVFILFPGTMSAEALVKGWNPPEEQALSPEANGDNPLGIIIEPSSEVQDEENSNPMDGISMNNYPDLGSEQVFPFEPGLGNSGF